MIFEFSDVPDAGLGFAVSCGYGKGSHIRETDIFIELINPVTGEVVRFESPKKPGFSNYGEIVFTTLNRDSAPLVRYRTGYYSRWIFGECPCGSWLKRLDKIYPPEENGDQLIRLSERLLDRFALYVAMLENGRFDELHRLYLSRLFRLGVEADYSDANGRFRATITGVEPGGHLLLTDTEGHQRRYAFKEVKYE